MRIIEHLDDVYSVDREFKGQILYGEIQHSGKVLVKMFDHVANVIQAAHRLTEKMDSWGFTAWTVKTLEEHFYDREAYKIAYEIAERDGSVVEICTGSGRVKWESVGTADVQAWAYHLFDHDVHRSVVIKSIDELEEFLAEDRDRHGVAVLQSALIRELTLYGFLNLTTLEDSLEEGDEDA